MEPIVIGGPLRQCKSCDAKNIQAFYTCEECEKKGREKNFDVCLDCAQMPTCEAHTENMGLTHKFSFARRRRMCGICSEDICTDFINCINCEKSPPNYDLCAACLLNSTADLLEHNRPHDSLLEFSRWVHIRPLFRLVKSVLTSPNDMTKGIVCGCGEKFTGTKTRFFLVMNGEDLCAKCADNGGLLRVASKSEVPITWIHTYGVYADDDLDVEDPFPAQGGSGSGRYRQYNNPEQAN